MRHRSGQRKLNITNGAHRIAMLRNISNSLIEYEQIKTTLARAKELRRFVEPLITLGKKSSVANRRLAFSRLRHRQNVGKLFDDLGKRFAARPGGYVRVLKCGYRVGDNAPMALVELVERRQEEAAGAVAPALPQTDQPAAAEVSEAAVSAESAESAETVKTQAPAENDAAPAAEADESDKSK